MANAGKFFDGFSYVLPKHVQVKDFSVILMDATTEYFN
jgi:hypothetical protein